MNIKEEPNNKDSFIGQRIQGRPCMLNECQFILHITAQDT